MISQWHPAVYGCEGCQCFHPILRTPFVVVSSCVALFELHNPDMDLNLRFLGMVVRRVALKTYVLSEETGMAVGLVALDIGECHIKGLNFFDELGCGIWGFLHSEFRLRYSSLHSVCCSRYQYALDVRPCQHSGS